MDIYSAEFLIAEMISTTNNGKLMKQNIPATARKFVPELIAKGWLKRASFIEAGDSVTLPYNNLETEKWTQ